MDNELFGLVIKYRECLEKLSRFQNDSAKGTVDTTLSVTKQRALTDRESHSIVTKSANDQVSNSTLPESKATETKLDAILSKLNLESDTVLSKELTDAKAAKLAVQLYLDNVIWKLFSRTELQNNALLFNNDLNRINDKKCLMKLMKTLIDIDRETQLKLKTREDDEVDAVDVGKAGREGKEVDQFLEDLHSWLVQVMAIYLRLCTASEKRNVVEILLATTHIADWAIPVIQFRMEKINKTDEYISSLELILCGAHLNPLMDDDGTHWTEDDYLSVIEQLAIDYNLRKVIDSIPADCNPQILFILCQKLSDILMKAIQRFSSMQMLVKRLSQILAQISVQLVDAVNEKGWTACQNHIDLFISQIVKGLYDMEGGKGWAFLANINYGMLSINALWDITLHLLQIKSNIVPTAVSDVLADNLPNTTRFQYALHQNQAQGYFLINCLTNITLSIPSSVLNHINFLSNPSDILSTCIIIVISYTLFMIAFVDKQLRELFYKDVRDSFSHISREHTFIISMLLQWTVQHINIMERMAVYLFRSIDLQNWHIVRDDLQLLHQLLVSPASPLSTSHAATIALPSKSNRQHQPAEIMFAKYILEHLNYELRDGTESETNISKSQPWCERKIPFLDYDIHEEIAFILLDACQQYQPLPDSSGFNKDNHDENKADSKEPLASASSNALSLADGMHLLSARKPVRSVSTDSRKGTKKTTSTSDTTSVNASEFIEWAWTIATQLKLFDCPVSSRANDIEATIDIPFLRQILNHPQPTTASHGALLIYVSFMLSTTSRHFLRFETAHGWLKLLVMLKRSNKPEVLIQILSEMIPSFVYMHGDDFFNDEGWNDILKQMVDFKVDPMLSQSANRIIKVIEQQRQQQHRHTRNRAKEEVKFPSQNVTGVGFIISSNLWHAHLIDSVSNLLDESGKGFSYVDLVMHSWLKTVFRRHDWMWHQAYVSMMDTLCQVSWALRQKDRLIHHMLLEEYQRIVKAKEHYNANSPRLSRMLKNMVIPEDAVATLTIGEWSVLRTANTFNKTTPGIENRLFWFAFEALLVETAAEQPLRQGIAEILCKQVAKDSKQHQTSQNHSIDITSVYKQTANHSKKPIEYFAIYRWLQHILIMPFDHPLLPLYLQLFFSLYYQTIVESDDCVLSGGLLFFDKKQDMVRKLQDYIANVQTYYGQKMTTTTYGHNSSTETLCPETLQQLYYAMWLWLGNAELISLKADLHTLPTLYDPARLKEIYGKNEQAQPWVTHTFWLDLIDMAYIERRFLDFPWIGANKIREKVETEQHYQQSLKSKSSSTDIRAISLSSSSLSLSTSTSTTTRRDVRILTDESTIMPLPPLIINKPTTASTGSISKKSKH